MRAEEWERDRRAAYAAFDYGALDRALEGIREADGDAHHALVSVFEFGWQADEGWAHELCERGLAALDLLLPSPLRAPKEVVRGPALLAGAHRDREIRRLLREGAAAQWVAGEFGLSVSQVNRIGRGR